MTRNFPRLTTGIKIHGTKSFRLSCGKLLSAYGVNLQNPPEVLLTCCHPSRPDYSFVQVDQSGAESLIVAYEAEPGLYRALAEANVKPHVYVALHIFIDKFRGTYPRDRYWKRSPEELKALPEWPSLVKTIKSSKDEYKLGKMTNHARSYKMHWPTFQLSVLKNTGGQIVLSSAEAKAFLATWDELFPEVIAWQDYTEAQVNTNRRLTNLFGYPREFYGKMNDALVREAISWVPQSTVGVITHIAYKKLSDYIEDNDLPWYMLSNKHDSYLDECPTDQAMDSARKMCEFINLDLVSHNGTQFKMKSEASIGLNLGKWHPTDNPQGMREVELTSK